MKNSKEAGDWIVPYNYLPMQFSDRGDISERLAELAKSGEFTLGPYVREFEENFAKFAGVKYCVSTNNGTDALILSLKSLGIREGDEVITVPNSFYATTGSIVAVGAKPVFVDVDDNYQMDYKLIEESISSQTKAILPVYWGGSSPDMGSIIKIANKHEIPVIEDACMGIGGKFLNNPMGTLGTIGAYSMHPLKSLNVMGDGGMITTNREDLYSWMIKYRNHGMSDRDHIDFWGINMRLQPIQAIVANIELESIPEIINKRNSNAKYYDEQLLKFNPEITIPNRRIDVLETFSLYMVLCEKRDELLEFLKKRKIDAKVHYPIPLHLQEAARKYNYMKGSFPVTEAQASKLITLPVHQYLNSSQLEYTISSISEFYS